MAKRRLLLFCLSLSAPARAVLASPDIETPAPTKTAFGLPEVERALSQHDLRIFPRVRPTVVDEQRLGRIPVTTPRIRLEKATTLSSSPACSITVAPALDQIRARQANNQAVTIIFLSSALASASSNMLAVSQHMASSISQLQSSISAVAASASNAILSLQASAARELAAAEASASDAIELAEESAVSRVNHILAHAGLPTTSMTGVSPQKNTYQRQVLRNQETSLSVAMVAVAIVASVVGSTFFSILGFYLFVYRRRRKQQRKREEKGKEDEVDVNAALDRAIVSYIAKESPGLMTPDSQKMGQSFMIDDAMAKTQKPPWLVVSPPPLKGHRSRPSLPVNASPRMASAATRPGHTRHSSIPPGPPPIGPLPEIPAPLRTPRTPRTPANLPKRTTSRSSPDSAERIYSQILTQPLETSASIPPTVATLDAETPTELKGEPASKRESGWPLTRTGWL